MGCVIVPTVVNPFALLVTEKTSQVLVQKAGMRVYLGHEMETLDYEGKQGLVKSFFNGNMDEPAFAHIK